MITEDGEQLGILAIHDALDIAFDRGLDLVEVSPNADPPVCKIMDFGKFKYQQSKRKTEARKKQTIIQVKEVKLRTKTETHDIQTKVKNLLRFIGEGNKVKISVMFSGREITHPELGVSVLNRVMDEVGEKVTIDTQPRMEGRCMVMFVSPRSDK